MMKCFLFEMRNIKSTLKLDLILLGIYVVLSIAIKSSIGIMLIFLLAMTIGRYPFLFESNTKLLKFTSALPLRKTDLVKGRYLYLVFGLIISWIISASIVLMRYNIGTYDYANVVSCFSSGALVSIIALIQYPLYYKYGLIKGRFLSMAIYILPIIIVMLLPQYARDMSIKLIEPQNLGMVSLVLFCGLLLALFISYSISKTIIKNKEL